MKFRRITALVLSILLLCSVLTACTDEQISTAADIVSELADAAFEEADGTPTAPEPTAQETEQPSEQPTEKPHEETQPYSGDEALDEHGSYTTAEDVSRYLIAYGKLPENFITKSEAKALGWEGGSLEKYAPGKCIGGDTFGNREGLLPAVKGRRYYECDINTLGAKSRGAERIIYSSDGYIYYTSDHYESFTELYTPEKQP